MTGFHFIRKLWLVFFDYIEYDEHIMCNYSLK